MVFNRANSQIKPSLNMSIFNEWPFVNSPSISNDGKYIGYVINRGYTGSRTLIVQSVAGTWKRNFPNVQSYVFTNKDHKLILKMGKDSVCIVSLGLDKKEILLNFKSFEYFMIGKRELLLGLDGLLGKFVIKDLGSNSDYVFEGVNSYYLNKKFNTLILKRNQSDHQSLFWLDLNSFKEYFICNGSNIENLVVDENRRQIAFIAQSLNGSKDIWYYRIGENNPSHLYSLNRTLMDSSSAVLRINNFNTDGTKLFVEIKKESAEIKGSIKDEMVEVWSYSDPRLKSQELYQSEENRSYLGILDLEDKSLLRLQNENETISFLSNTNDSLANIVFNKGEQGESEWNSLAKSAHYILNCWTGERKRVDYFFQTISPNGKYLVGQDDSSGNLVYYDLKSGQANRQSQLLKINIGLGLSKNLSIIGWIAKNNHLLLHDGNDIWSVDIEHPGRSINMTNGFGYINDIDFRIAASCNDSLYGFKDIELLAAFNKSTKENGFYFMNTNLFTDPTKLTMGACVYSYPANYLLDRGAPIKAKNTNLWIVQRESCENSPNYYLTSNFKDFLPISNNYPEKAFNWVTSDLLNYTTLDGKNLRGVLYKPENFNPNLKYPVIITYYEQLSDKLNLYIKPEAARDRINIPWLVSRGYLVLTTDIHYEKGKPGLSAVNSIIGAVSYLKNNPWIDSTRIGLQGHSFGAYETNFVVSQTNIFSAAISTSGVSDLVSSYGSLWAGGQSKQVAFENGQYRIGGNLWNSRELFIENSPIFFVNNISTPILLINNKNDKHVPVTQGIEFFTALRRLKKKAWMLQYKGEGHSIINNEASIDYTIKMDQFFDHFLKDAPEPLWMIDGTATKDKGRK